MIWILACISSPWTEDAALSPTLARLDTDGDGAATATELAPVAPGLDFGVMDTSGNGQLSTTELAAYMDATDPLTFDNRFGRPAVSREQAAAREHMAYEVRMLQDLFFFLTAEIMAADPAIPRPGEHHLRAAAATASLSSPQSVAVLDELRAGYATAGLTFPPGLEAP